MSHSLCPSANQQWHQFTRTSSPMSSHVFPEVLFPQVLHSNHFHYKSTHFTSLQIQCDVTDDRQITCRVRSDRSLNTIYRSLDDLIRLDVALHTCLLSRHFSRLPKLTADDVSDDVLREYTRRLCDVISSTIVVLNCSLVLNWFQIDNCGQILQSEHSDVNRRAIGAAFAVKEYHVAEEDQNPEKENEIKVFLSLEIGDLVSIIEFNSIIDSPDQSHVSRFWSKGKKGFQVGFFPSECVRLIDCRDAVVQSVVQVSSSVVTCPTTQLSPKSKLIQFFNRFYRESNETKEKSKKSFEFIERNSGKVFGRDLCEHLFINNLEIPFVVNICMKFVEKNGLLDGIYRLSGVSSNIHKLRQLFDQISDPFTQNPELDLDLDPNVTADVHCVASLLKLYFRELPNPLLTFQLYDSFVETIRDRNSDPDRKLCQIIQLVHTLPPPHRRTLSALIHHLNRVSKAANVTGMTPKNLAIVWAPNLLRSRDIDQRSVGGDLAALQVIGIQAVLTEYLIQNCEIIFDDSDDTDVHCRPRVSNTDDDTNENKDDRDDHRFKMNLKLFLEQKFQIENQWNERRHSLSSSLSSSANNCRIRRQEWCRSKSFNSFFGSKPDFELKFAKIGKMFALNNTLTEIGFNPKFQSIATNITNKRLECEPIVTTCPPIMTTAVVRENSRLICNDSTTVQQNVVIASSSARERIERIKAERRQQLRQQFDTKPIPTPRKSIPIPSKLRQIGPKVDARRPQTTTPVPTPRRRNSCETSSNITITPLKTTAKSRRNNWNRSATQVFESK